MPWRIRPARPYCRIRRPLPRSLEIRRGCCNRRRTRYSPRRPPASSSATSSRATGHRHLLPSRLPACCLQSVVCHCRDEARKPELRVTRTGTVSIQPTEAMARKALATSEVYQVCKCIRRSSCSFEIHHPVGFPGGSPIGRERLLPMTRRGSDPGPHEAHADRSAVERVVSEERSYAVVKGAYHGRIQGALWHPAIEPPDSPRALVSKWRSFRQRLSGLGLRRPYAIRCSIIRSAHAPGRAPLAGDAAESDAARIPA